MTFFDASWCTGGNRDRGIGRYLDYWLRNKERTGASDRLWLFPEDSKEADQRWCTRRYGGQVVIVPSQGGQGRLVAWWREQLRVFSPDALWILSPFERPWSLLDIGAPLFQENTCAIHAFIFDLLPLQFPRTILNTWSEIDQKKYQQRVQILQSAAAFVVISPIVSQQVQSLLHIPKDKITLPGFGMKLDWISVAKDSETDRMINKEKHVVTISGGEWRKNLVGTLEFFAVAFPGDTHLDVLCRLGWKQKSRLWWLSWRLGILGRVHFWGQVSEKLKWQLLFSAEAGLFLSHAEGLGIPLLEYSRAGIPRIIVSRRLVEDGFGEWLPDYFESTL